MAIMIDGFTVRYLSEKLYNIFHSWCITPSILIHVGAFLPTSETMEIETKMTSAAKH